MTYRVGSKVRAARDLTDAAGVTIPAGTPGVVTKVLRTDVYSVKFESWPVNFTCVGSDLLPDPIPERVGAVFKKATKKKPAKKIAKRVAKKPAKKAAKKKSPPGT